MTYTCKFKCGAETETLNQLKWHYQSNHADKYNFETDIKPIVDQMMLESGPVEPGDTIYPDGTSRKYNQRAAFAIFLCISLIPGLIIGMANTWIAWEVLSHQAAIVLGALSAMAIFFLGGVLAVVVQVLPEGWIKEIK